MPRNSKWLGGRALYAVVLLLVMGRAAAFPTPIVSGLVSQSFGLAPALSVGVQASPLSIGLSSCAVCTSGLGEMSRLRRLVEEEGACSLPGVMLRPQSFVPTMWEAVARGFVSHEHASFIADGLLHGFTAGIDVSLLKGHRWFRNYESALNQREAVIKGTMSRVEVGKTHVLARWSESIGRSLRSMFSATAIFPLGAVPKWPEWWKYRQTDDHTRTGVNAATTLGILKHSLDTYQEIATHFLRDHFMRVSDVEGAFTLLPFHPDIWPFMLHRFELDVPGVEYLLLHTCGDFGTSGMPGTFKIFFTDVVMGMARAAAVLTLPTPVYVDDTCTIGADEEQVNDEMLAFHEWAGRVCGVDFKAIKDKVAAQRQQMLGFFWDSRYFTRELEPRRYEQYVEMLDLFASKRKLSLHDMQSLAGRMQRCVMTFPPGAACLLTSLFGLMTGLRLPWHTRRMSKQVRSDLKSVNSLLQLGLGRGYYSYADFRQAPEVRTDASKSTSFCGGGYVSGCGRYNFWSYGSRASRRLIDFLEGDTVVRAIEELGHLWYGCIVTFRVDNTAFQKSARKGRSRVDRLNDLVREIFHLCIKFNCVVLFEWISSEDNLLADHLSRDRELDFLAAVFAVGFWVTTVKVRRHRCAGDRRVLPEFRGRVDFSAQRPFDPDERPSLEVEARRRSDEHDGSFEVIFGESTYREARFCSVCFTGIRTFVCKNLPHEATCGAWRCTRPECPGRGEPCVCTQGFYEDDPDGASPPSPPPSPPAPQVRGSGSGRMTRLILWAALLLGHVQSGFSAPVSRQGLSVPYTRSSIFSGLPPRLEAAVEMALDNRYSSSSWRTIATGVRHWRGIAEEFGWPTVISTDDPDRGGKLAAFLVMLAADTDLVWGSIEGYYWGMRTWQQLQHQLDPAMGVAGLDGLLQAVKVLTWVPNEPRARVPIEHIQAVLESLEPSSFADCSLALIILILLFTYSRTECPCPKTRAGRDAYRYKCHWSVSDFDVKVVNGKRVFAVRFWVIKQDQRVERPEARTEEGDWVYISDLPGTVFSVFTWFSRFSGHLGTRPDREAPFFVDPDYRSRPWLYRQALAAFQAALTGLGFPSAGLHGLRVAGYNGTRAVLGQEIAVAQGGWQSGAHNRYWRCSMASILDIPSAIIGALGTGQPAVAPDPDPERVARVPGQRVVRQDLARALDEDLEDFVDETVDEESVVESAESHASLLPPEWREERRTTRSSGVVLSRPYTVYFGPRGERAESRPAAWRMYDMSTQDQRARAEVSNGATGGSTPSQVRREGSGASASVSPTRRRRPRAASQPVETLDPEDDLSLRVPFWERPPEARPGRGVRSS